MSVTTYDRDKALATNRSLTFSVSGSAVFACFTILVLVVTALPYFIASRAAPSGWQFMGIVMNVPDTSQYLSWARESSHSFLIQNKLTSEHGAAVYYNLFFFVVGQLAAALHIGYAAALQVIRPLAGVVCLTAIFWFSGLFFTRPLHRWTAALIASLGGGLGWLLVVQKLLSHAADVAYPLDIYVTEPNAFLSIMAFPLQAMANGLIVFVLGLAALAFERNSIRVALGAGVLALVLGLQHGYDLVVVYVVVGSVAAVLAVRGGWRFRPILLAAVVCIPSGPTAIWNLAITHFDPIWRATLSQYGNAGAYTPPPIHVLVLLGLPLVLTLVGLVAVAWQHRLTTVVGWARTSRPRELLLIAWIVLGAALLYIPTDFQIKMFVSWQVPLSIFATGVLFSGLAAAARRIPRLRTHQVVAAVGALAVIATLPTNTYLLGWRVVDLERQGYPYDLRTDEVIAMDWLGANTDHFSPVLSSLTVGQYLPSVSGNNAFLAHWAATIDYYAKEREVALFFNTAAPDSFRHDLLQQYGIEYVFYGPAERELGSYNPDDAPFLRRVFSDATVSVYQVALV